MQSPNQFGNHPIIHEYGMFKDVVIQDTINVGFTPTKSSEIVA